jgi:hypothetical protein
MFGNVAKIPIRPGLNKCLLLLGALLYRVGLLARPFGNETSEAICYEYQAPASLLGQRVSSSLKSSRVQR